MASMIKAHPKTRLVSRYGRAHGMYLYGEYCLLVTLGFEAFRKRHTDVQLQFLAAQLAPLALWPDGEADWGEPAPLGILEGVAATLLRPPLHLGLGVDLYFSCLSWAGNQDGVQGDPAAWFEPTRAALSSRLGFLLPPLAVHLDDGVSANGHRLYIWGEAILEGDAYPGLDQMLGPMDQPPPQIPYNWSLDASGSRWITWLPIGPGATPPQELERIHWIVAINRQIEAVLPEHAPKLLTGQVVQDMLHHAEASGYDHELERYVSIPELKLVFQTLLRQGLRLEPAPMLEAVMRAILSDLARRSVSPPEMEQIARQLPIYTTQRLVTIIRFALGLPEVPLRPLNVERSPAPVEEAHPSALLVHADRWNALAQRARDQRVHAEQIVRVLRMCAPSKWRRSGYGLRWCLHLTQPEQLEPLTPQAAQLLRESRILGNLQRTIERYIELLNALTAIEWAIANPGGRALPAIAKSMVENPCWEQYEWWLNEPGRLMRAIAPLAGI